MLVLAEARCHYVALKLEAQNKSVTEDKIRMTFSGNAIVLPHKPQTTKQEFGAEALKAALGAIRVFFVGPNGTQGQLEKIALRINDFRLRPEVIYNFLMIKHVLHGTERPPAIEVVTEMISTHGNIAQHVRKTVSCWLEADISDLEKERSDISGIRRGQDTEDNAHEHAEQNNIRAPSTTNGQQEGHGDNGESARATSSKTEDDVTENSDPVIHLIGHIELPSLDIATVMDGITEAMTEEEEKEKNTNKATEGNPPHLRHLLLNRAGEKALDDYLGGPEMMYKTYWPLMPLKRGFTPGRRIPDSKWHQLFLYHDNRFSSNNTIIFHAANIIMRHAVNRSVHAGIKAKPEAFAAFKAEMASPNFKDELERARANPRSRDAGKLIQRLMRFIAPCPG